MNNKFQLKKLVFLFLSFKIQGQRLEKLETCMDDDLEGRKLEET